MAEPAAGDGGRIVVGVDGSDSSKAALRWAVRQARLTGARVEAVHAWQYPTTAYGWAVTETNVESVARLRLEEMIAGAAGPDADVEVQPVVQQGHPAQVLLDAARGAELLVVGNRGHGGFAGALLGSVGQHVVQHAACPVVVVRDGPGSGAAQ